MAEQTLQYDARDLVAVWGEIEIGGFAPGTFITITYDDDQVKKTRGAQNFVVAVVTGNDSGSVQFTLSQASPTNDRLSAVASLQLRQGVGLIKKSLFIKHVNGNTLVVGPEAWIKKIPDAAFSDDHETREWTLDVAHLSAFVGGSTR